MPNRVIKESICTSETVAGMTDFEFRLWIGLIVSADDAGRGDARPAIIKGRVFPLRERVAIKDISAALHGLAAKGCVSLYEVDGKPYFWFPTWKDHQRIRDCKPKYPEPPECTVSPQIAADCRNSPQIAADGGYAYAGAESESESDSESESESNTNSARASASRFKPPTVEEVADYCRERGNHVDPQRFVDHYTSNGWKVGKNPMKDWKAAVRTWEKNSEGGNNRGHPESPGTGTRGADRSAAWGIKSIID